MIKLQTGVSTDMDFIKAMKERGQDVNAEFPAETLRTQLDLVSEDVKVTFNSPNETILEAVNEWEPTPPAEQVTITFDVEGEGSGEYPNVTIGDEVIQDLPVTLTEDKGTELPYVVSLSGYETIEGTLVFDEDKTVTETLVQSVKLRLNYNEGTDGEGNGFTDLHFGLGTTVDLSEVFDTSSIKAPFFANSFKSWTTELEKESTEVTQITMDRDKTLYAEWNTKKAVPWDEYTPNNSILFKEIEGCPFDDSSYSAGQNVVLLDFVPQSQGLDIPVGKFSFMKADPETGKNNTFIFELGDVNSVEYLHVEYESDGEEGSVNTYNLLLGESYFKDYLGNTSYFVDLPKHRSSEYVYPKRLEYVYPRMLPTYYTIEAHGSEPRHEAVDAFVDLIGMYEEDTQENS